jgi:hypothetical protein
MASVPRNPARTFEDLLVWQKAHALVLDLYRLSERFPREEVSRLLESYRAALAYSCQPTR